MNKYKRTLDQLRSQAILHWPRKLLQAASDVSVLPLLIQSQDVFISLLKVSNKKPDSWRQTLSNTTALSGPLFLKHLMVLSDLGGEALNKITPLKKYIPNGVLEFEWHKKPFRFQFKEIQSNCNLTNSGLKVDSKALVGGGALTDKMTDVVMLLLYGSLINNDSLPFEVKEKCIIGSLMKSGVELDQFVKESYIRVSRQVGGATSNELGQQAQNYVVERLRTYLPNDWKIERDATLPGVAHKEGGDETTFDIVAQSRSRVYFGIEVSFQVTTNSVIERKSREAEALQASAHRAGHKICYVIDGAGNINIRANAVSNLCTHSDCTVAFSEKEIQHLAAYLLGEVAR